MNPHSFQLWKLGAWNDPRRVEWLPAIFNSTPWPPSLTPESRCLLQDEREMNDNNRRDSNRQIRKKNAEITTVN